MEFKARGGPLSPAQEAFAAKCAKSSASITS
jgi:hypothetical protein